MTPRLNMNAKNSSGNQVSLLNDDPAPPARTVYPDPFYSPYPPQPARTYSNASAHSTASSPKTPDLWRSNSYDSQNTSGPRSPLTPGPAPPMEFGKPFAFPQPPYYHEPVHMCEQRAPYFDYAIQQQQHLAQMRQLRGYDDHAPSPYSESYDSDSYANPPTTERGPKRYPCRFRETHGCDKTFTTSCHASRHSKIHTAEKAVACSYAGCQKKFTRADNMKQHLETHFKGKSRSGSWQKSTAAAKSALIKSAGIRKAGSTGRPSRPPSAGENRPELAPYQPGPPAQLLTDRYAGASSASSSMATSPVMPSSPHAMSVSPPPRESGPASASSGRSSLDVLAVAAASQAEE